MPWCPEETLRQHNRNLSLFRGGGVLFDGLEVVTCRYFKAKNTLMYKTCTLTRSYERLPDPSSSSLNFEAIFYGKKLEVVADIQNRKINDKSLLVFRVIGGGFMPRPTTLQNRRRSSGQRSVNIGLVNRFTGPSSLLHHQCNRNYNHFQCIWKAALHNWFSSP